MKRSRSFARRCVARSHFGMSSSRTNVYTLSGACLPIDESNGTLTVWQAKRSIKLILGVPRRLQRLMEGTRVLGNHEEIRQERTLTLVTLSNSCHVCGMVGTVKSCSRCFSVCYCSESCQVCDWKRHKLQCVAIGRCGMTTNLDAWREKKKRSSEPRSVLLSSSGHSCVQ